MEQETFDEIQELRETRDKYDVTLKMLDYYRGDYEECHDMLIQYAVQIDNLKETIEQMKVDYKALEEKYNLFKFNNREKDNTIKLLKDRIEQFEGAGEGDD